MPTNPNATLTELTRNRATIVAILCDLVRRRRRLRREVATEALAGLAGGSVCVIVHAATLSCTVIAFAAVGASLLAARDRRKLHGLQARIDALARVVAAFA